MDGYLLDTDTCVSRIRRKFDIDQRIAQVGKRNCCVSEITIAELRFGAERGNQREEQMLLIDTMYEEFSVLPIVGCDSSFRCRKSTVVEHRSKDRRFRPVDRSDGGVSRTDSRNE